MFEPIVFYISQAIRLPVAGICPANTQSVSCAPSPGALRA